MELNVLNSALQKIAVIDNYSSLIWTKRYYECGDFELYVRADSDTLALFKNAAYVSRDDDDMTCLIETIKLTTDIENGNYLTISGRCLKSLLERRIVWYQTNLYGRADLALEQLINHNAVDTDNINRWIDHLHMGTTPYAEETINKQITGDNLYDTVIDFCKTYEWGWEITNNDGIFTVNVYKGTDRTKSVTFSAEYDNLPRTNYIYSTRGYKNTARVAGEGEGTSRRTYSVNNDKSGLDRYELFVDARDISSNDGEIAEYDYLQLLKRRGLEKLAESKITDTVDGEVETTEQYVYKQDYFVGDIVKIKTEYGITATARILEVIECQDETGYSIIPTFSNWEV